jgi:addiction module RelE/StbE family toxin
MQVIWSPPALDDLDRIVAYIEDSNPWAASRLAVQIISAADSLERLPRRGRPGIEFGTRELVVAPYVIVYRVADRVEIARIWHGAQNR